MRTILNQNRTVAVIGVGPVGLAAAAHLIAAGNRFILFEAGDSAGANIRTWGHVRLFSPWRYNLDKQAARLLRDHGVQLPDEDALPTGNELVDEYLAPLAALPVISEHLHLNTRVLSVSRIGLDKVKTAGRERLPFSIQAEQDGEVRLHEADAIIDATGTWGNPNPMGSGGVAAFDEDANRDRINYAIPDILGKDQQRYANKSVLVVGSGHSAVNSILELDRLAEEFPRTRVHWILRKKDLREVYGGQQADALRARGALGVRIEKLVGTGRINIHRPVSIQQVRRDDRCLTIHGQADGEAFALGGIDEVIANTGSRPDFSFLREVRFEVDAALECVPALAELIDPNIHSCGTVRPHGVTELRQPEQDFYIAGMKAYGRAPTFLMATGYEQVRSIVAHLNGDEESARRVELDLPQTGVCSLGIPAQETAALECCNAGTGGGSGLPCGADRSSAVACGSDSRSTATACC